MGIFIYQIVFQFLPKQCINVANASPCCEPDSFVNEDSLGSFLYNYRISGRTAWKRHSTLF